MCKYTNEMKVKLIFPPFWAVSYPYLGIPSIASYLREKGIECSQIDLNLEMYDYILSREFAEKCYDKIKLDLLNNNELQKKEKPTLDFSDYVINHIEEYKEMFRSKKALDIRIYQKCISFFDYFYSIVSKAYKNEKLTYSSYTNNHYSTIKSESIINLMEDLLNDELPNMLIYDVLLKYIDSIICDCNVVGISLTDMSQMLPTFLLVAMIRKHAPDIKIVLGGNVIGRLIERIQNIPRLFKFVDYFMYGEGEHPWHMLIKHLKEEISIEDVPNIVYIDKGIVNKNEDNCYVDINLLPTPVFDKENIRRYFSPEVVLPLLTSRGCFWGKCAFCDHSYIYNGKYRKRRIELIMEDIKEYIEEYDCVSINFHDEAIAPKEIEKISCALIENDINITWSTCARLDLALNKNVLSKAKKSGLRVLFFGLESINNEVLHSMNKGTRPDNIKMILKDSAECEIWNHTFFMCGFPTDNINRFNETLEFVQNEYVHSAGCGFFSTGLYSTVTNNPEKYCIQIIQDDNDFKLWYEYKGNEEWEELRKYFYENKEKFHKGVFSKFINFISRDHWNLFAEDLHILNEQEDVRNEIIEFVPCFYWDTYNNKLNLYTFTPKNKLRVVSIDIMYKDIIEEMEKECRKEEIIENCLKKNIVSRDNVNVIEALIGTVKEYGYLI